MHTLCKAKHSIQARRCSIQEKEKEKESRTNILKF